MRLTVWSVFLPKEKPGDGYCEHHDHLEFRFGGQAGYPEGFAGSTLHHNRGVSGNQDGLAEGYDFYIGIESHMYPLASDGWLHLTSLEGEEELHIFSHMPAALHRGEASCLAVAVRRGMAFLTDDARARSVARELQVVVSGTLGILVRAVTEEHLSLEVADSVLNQMIKAGYHSPYGTLAGLLTG